MAGKKKDFTTANTGRVYSTITEATQEARKEYSAQEAQEMREAGTTQGRKGCKAIRINMAFTPEVHEYIKVMARVRGESITDFTNYVFKQSMADNADLYEQAKSFQQAFK